MGINHMFNDASIVMTVVSLLTFLGILFWVYGYKRSGDFDEVAHLPFDDERYSNAEKMEGHHD